VLCLGILYHLDEPDVFSLIDRIGDTCDHIAIFDTYVSLAPVKRYTYEGKDYYGRDVQEHNPENAGASKSDDLWSSMYNDKSVWITKATLYNMLLRNGFTSVYECDVPLELDKPLDRVTIVAIKGQPAKMLAARPPAQEESQMPEHWRRIPSQHQQRFAHASKRISNMFPPGLKRGIKRQLRAFGLFRRKIQPWEWSDPFRRREGQDR